MTDDLRKTTERLAARYGFSHEAVLTLFDALVAGHGTMAQFSHPELGGMGQWTRGGMIMIGELFNGALRTQVDSLCQDLSCLLDDQPNLEGQESPLFKSQWQRGPGTHGGVTLPESHSGEQSAYWWGAELGAPSSTGSQGSIRYAYFPATRRLAVSIGDEVTIYDTQTHEITGFSQQQGSDSTLTFASQHGSVPMSSLRVVRIAGGEAAGQCKDAPTGSNANQASDAGKDVFAKIERLAELRKRGIVSEEEFAEKKAELLARL